MRDLAFGLGQLLGAVAAVAGLYMLTGLAWTLVIAGVATLVCLVAVEALARSAQLPPATEAPRRRRRPSGPPDELPWPDQVTEMPGAVRGPRKES